MSWVSDLGDLVGIPAGFAVAAVAISAAGSGADSLFRKERIGDLTSAISHPVWTSAIEPALFVERLFEATFGKRQLSLKCVVASVVATVTIALSSVLLIKAETGMWPNISFPGGSEVFWFLILIALIAGFVPDYIAIAKSRYLLKRRGLFQNRFWLLVAVDLALSIFISNVVLALSTVPEDVMMAHEPSGLGWLRNVWDSLASISFLTVYDALTEGAPSWLFYAPDGTYPVAVLFFSSTVFTSIWIASIWTATLVLNATSLAQRLTLWLFDVNEKPFRAVGIVAGGLIMVVGLAWAVMRAFVASLGTA